MSKGPGTTQRRLLDILQAAPTDTFTIDELAKAVFPDVSLEQKHRSSIYRALKGLPVTKHRKVSFEGRTQYLFRLVTQ